MKGAASVAGEEARMTMSLQPSERAEVRHNRYKVVVDTEDGRRRRENSMVEICKSRREESLLKKRRDDLPPSIVVAAQQMAHSSTLQQKVITSMARMQAKPMDATIAMKLSWAAVIGNHDQEGTLAREGVMHHLVGMKNTLSRFHPGGVEIDDYRNYNLEVGGVEGTLLANKSVLNL